MTDGVRTITLDIPQIPYTIILDVPVVEQVS